MRNIPLVDLKANYRSIKEDIDLAIQAVIDESSFILGPFLATFEQNFAAFCNAKYAIGCSSGTSALHLALLAAGLNPGDEVITVPNTFIATTEMISCVRGKIRFVDVNEQTQLIDIEQLSRAISPRTKAIIVVHLYGQMPDMEQIREITDKNDLFLIEDAAQAHAAEWRGHQPGHYGDVATFSFFPAKNLGCFGDGGCVVTNDGSIAEKVRLLVDHGRTSKYIHSIEGYNYRLDALQAAILNAKLPHLPRWTALRRAHASFYNEALPASIEKPVEGDNAKHVYYMYVIRTTERDELMQYLKEKGIQCGVHYPVPLHVQPAYAHLGLTKGNFPIAEKLADEILSLPVYPELTDEQLTYIVDSVNQFFTERR